MGPTTVAELIELLEEMPQDAQVRIATQPSWPFEHMISDVALAPAGEGDEEDGEEPTDTDVVYIGEGHQVGYLNSQGRTALEW